MNEISKLFFQLIKVSLGNSDHLSRTLSKDEWETLYDLAEKHAIVGICFMGIQRLPKEQLPDKFVLMEWMGQTERIRTRNAYMDECCLKLQDRLERDGQQYCILKGQGVATYYGNLASYRQSGDIDVWISGGAKNVKEYACRISLVENTHERHVELKIFDDVEIEAHFLPTKLTNLIANRRLQKWFDYQEPIQMQNIIPFGKEKMHVPTLEFNFVYVLLHIYRHLFNEGVGLRQLMDYYFVLKTANISDDEKNRVREVISSLGLDNFAKGVMWVLHEVFGMNLSYAIWTLDERYGRFLLSEVMQMGNFGHSDSRYLYESSDWYVYRLSQVIKKKLSFFYLYPLEVFWQLHYIFVKFVRNRFFFFVKDGR